MRLSKARPDVAQCNPMMVIQSLIVKITQHRIDRSRISGNTRLGEWHNRSSITPGTKISLAKQPKKVDLKSGLNCKNPGDSLGHNTSSKLCFSLLPQTTDCAPDGDSAGGAVNTYRMISNIQWANKWIISTQ
jgi:hypothetical protein